MKQSDTNRMLGYPPDARLLIINADDFGMCRSINEAIIATLREGLVRSTTIMTPCSGAPHAMRFLADHPETPFGVHLTVISDPGDHGWGPVAPRDKVPSLVNQAGYFYNFADMHARLARVDGKDLEVEFRAQIESVLVVGLQPTHLDWHALRFGERTDILHLMARLAREYGLALRVIGRSAIEDLQSQGLPTIDYDFLDSYGIDPQRKAARYAARMRELPAGLSEWAVHPGLDSADLLALEPSGNHRRHTDYDFWISPAAKELVQREGIILLDYRPLQEFWKTGAL